MTILAAPCQFANASISGLRLLLVVAALTASSLAVELKPRTEEEFNRFVREAESRITSEARTGDGFLLALSPVQHTLLRNGEILTETRLPGGDRKVTSGLIHDWAGVVFVPGVDVRDVIFAVQAYDRHKDFYKPEVVDSRLISRSGQDFIIMLRLLKKKVVTVVLQTEHAVHYEQIDSWHWWSQSHSIRIAEVLHPGRPDEEQLPPGTGRGFLWRLNSYWTFQELDGGTYVECEAISLTRDIPRGLGWLIHPIIRELPRESLIATLRGTRDAASRGGLVTGLPPFFRPLAVPGRPFRTGTTAGDKRRPQSAAMAGPA
ncbi:MAG: hypothetical protein JNN08_24685 [Bryobacterales bacterium]|nr:hypothetical protein [Bryobacterales bacterium]